jgi:hypothetical protein
MALGLGYADGGEFLGARRNTATAGAASTVAGDGRVVATNSAPRIESKAGNKAKRSRVLVQARQ